MPPPATTMCSGSCVSFSQSMKAVTEMVFSGRWALTDKRAPRRPGTAPPLSRTIRLDADAPPRVVPRPNAVGRQRARHPRRPGRAELPGRLTALEHAIGHLLGREPRADGLRAEELPAGTRRVPAPGPGLMGVAALGPAWEVALRAAVRHAEVVSGDGVR